MLQPRSQVNTLDESSRHTANPWHKLHDLPRTASRLLIIFLLVRRENSRSRALISFTKSKFERSFF